MILFFMVDNAIHLVKQHKARQMSVMTDRQTGRLYHCSFLSIIVISIVAGGPDVTEISAIMPRRVSQPAVAPEQIG